MKPLTQENRFSSNIFQGLRSPALFTRWPALGLAMFLAGGLVTLLLAYLLQTNEAFLQWDMAVAKTFRTIQINAPWTWMENMLFGAFLGKEVVNLLGAVLALFFFINVSGVSWPWSGSAWAGVL